MESLTLAPTHRVSCLVVAILEIAGLRRQLSRQRCQVQLFCWWRIVVIHAWASQLRRAAALIISRECRLHLALVILNDTLTQIVKADSLCRNFTQRYHRVLIPITVDGQLTTCRDLTSPLRS